MMDSALNSRLSRFQRHMLIVGGIATAFFFTRRHFQSRTASLIWAAMTLSLSPWRNNPCEIMADGGGGGTSGDGPAVVTVNMFAEP